MLQADHGQHFPVLPLDLRLHKVSITIHCVVILVTNSILPLALYFSLNYTTSLPQKTIIPIINAVIGAPTLGRWILRSWRLFHAEIFRPLASSNPWAFDYLNWNLTIGIIYLIPVLALASRRPFGLRLFSLILPLTVIQCSIQLLLLESFFLLGFRTPFSFSSVKAGSEFPAGVVLLAEDICAVDGNLGRPFRSALHKRIAASPTLETSLRQLDWIWGLSGVTVGATLIGIIFGVENDEIGVVIAFTIPWIWAFIFTILTIHLVRCSLEKEKQVLVSGKE
ncbi:hypothetical protein BDW59DRAFT_148807 [Aspergillus cavernicola]|uniref:Uncharacterized protein n=1 Tax=Aspergillus cavernicola TaxID=176166 RepID=A0ABR4I6V8_9EURO